MIGDTDKAAAKTSRLWWKLGILLERKAYERAESGLEQRAMEIASIADACFWQATGEMDSASIKDLLNRDAA